MTLFDQFNISDGLQDEDQPSRYGVTLARVTNLNDPDKLGRVKCAFITANKEALELDWAYVMTPFGGKNYGFFFMPKVDDVVLVAFDSGDVSRPYIIGSLWGSLADPPLKLKDGINELYQLKTPNQNTIEFQDRKDKECITVKTPKGRKVELNDKDKVIELSDGDNSVKMDGSSGEVLIRCKSKLTIQVGSNATITIDGNAGSVKIEGKQAVQIEGTQVGITAKATAAIKADAQVSVESSGITTVKGSVLKLN